ncbi:MAG: hypothetical protein MJ231_08405, partial [bacterium]|nr:hypothetical protein [bacterium]
MSLNADLTPYKVLNGIYYYVVAYDSSDKFMFYYYKYTTTSQTNYLIYKKSIYYKDPDGYSETTGNGGISCQAMKYSSTKVLSCYHSIIQDDHYSYTYNYFPYLVQVALDPDSEFAYNTFLPQRFLTTPGKCQNIKSALRIDNKNDTSLVCFTASSSNSNYFYCTKYD